MLNSVTQDLALPKYIGCFQDAWNSAGCFGDHCHSISEDTGGDGTSVMTCGLCPGRFLIGFSQFLLSFVHFDWFSLNPIDPEFITEERDVRRDYPGRTFKTIISNNIQSYSPFSKINKKGIARLCVKHNLEELVKLTISCETIHPPRPCKKCWWCNEKVWAFGYYWI